jgi:aryl-alcohol dehydrogenase-like predicted oxidoreductase
VTDFLDEKRKEITDRLKELKPLVDEYRRLEAAASALAGVGESAVRAAAGAAAGVATGKRGPGRPRGAAAKKPAAKVATRKRAKAGAKRAGRKKGSGTRAAEALAFVQGQPGITIPELAAKMGIKQNYLYRVLPGLEAEKKVEKKGRGWHPKS